MQQWQCTDRTWPAAAVVATTAAAAAAATAVVTAAAAAVVAAAAGTAANARRKGGHYSDLDPGGGRLGPKGETERPAQHVLLLLLLPAQ
jgi:hypothetical protein